MANLTATGKTRRRLEPGGYAGDGPSVDYASVFGVVGAFTVIGLAMYLGGSPGRFIDLPALLIVLGGTFLVTTISFTVEEVVRAHIVMLRAILYHAERPEKAARRILHLADRARRNGPLSASESLRTLRPSRFLNQAVSLIADGLPAAETEQFLVRECHETRERHIRSAGILRRAGEAAPAMGLIGTLVGLVQMLGSLEDPATIGPSMAVALLTTFYGAILANMVFHPLANKLERNSEVEAMVNQIYTLGASSIIRQENPRRLEMMINTILSPSQRINHFD